MSRFVLWSFALALVALVAPFAAAQPKPSPHPRVLGFERFTGNPKSDEVALGMLLLGELNCTSCHAADDSLSAYIVKKQAPIIDEIGSRARGEYFARFLANPQAVKAGTTMPNVFAGLSEEEAKRRYR